MKKTTQSSTRDLNINSFGTIREWAKSSPELKEILESYETNKPIMRILELIWVENKSTYSRMNKLLSIVEEFDRITSKGIFGKNTYSLRNEFFSELEIFKEKHSEVFNTVEEKKEKVMVESGTQLSFDDHLKALSLEEKFDTVWKEIHADSLFGELNQEGQERLKRMGLLLFKKGFYESID